jgi:hypothetical protein
MATINPDQMPQLTAPAASIVSSNPPISEPPAVAAAAPKPAPSATAPSATAPSATAPAVVTAVAAATGGNLSAKIDEWSNNLSWSIFIFIFVTLILVGITVILFSVGNLTEIAKNFPKYRCNPLMMPFAGQFGYDARENFTFCVSNILNNKAAEIFAPLYGILSQFTGILTVMMNATLGMRKLFSNFFLSVNGFIGNVRNRIQNLLFQIRMSFLKLNNLMGRVFGSMFAVIFMGTSALTAANNLGQTDLVKFLAEFCFDPETPVKLANGGYKPIKEIAVGDRLFGPNGLRPTVTSTFVFDGSHTEMVRIKDVTVSSQHFVAHNGSWIMASEHPDALPTASLPIINCLNVFGNIFYVGENDLAVRDYDESENPGVNQKVMQLALQTLNGEKSSEKKPLLNYDLGFDQRFPVHLADGSWIPAGEVTLGTVLEGGHKIVGIAHEICNEVVNLNGYVVSAAQLVHHQGAWHRAGHILPTRQINMSFQLINFITENSGPIAVRLNGSTLYLRDYREVALPEMELPYANFVKVQRADISCP